MPKDKLLEVRDLHVRFQTEEEVIKAVEGISFTLFRGETLGIVGESGSGKSVTALSLMRLIAQPPGEITGGEIIYFPEKQASKDLLKISEKEMQGFRGSELAMIFQEPMTSLNPVLKCGKQVTEAIQLHQGLRFPEAKRQAIDLFSKVQLADPQRVFNSYPHLLSGGQKQRVMIAMAMCCNPSLLIADEPTTSVDVTVQKAILDLMKELKQDWKSSILFISHDLGVVAEIADRVLVMYKGKIVEQGRVADIFNNPLHPYTKSLLACRPPLHCRLRRLPVADDFLKEEKFSDSETAGNEKSASLKEVVNSLIISPQEAEKRLAKLRESPPVLRVQDLKTWFPRKKNFFGKTLEFVKAVDGVSFEVFPGETLGLVGESGCGKTTLGRSILRLTPSRSGKVFFKNQSLTNLTDRELRSFRKDIQIIFQDPYSSLNPRKMVGKAILEPMQVHGILDSDSDREDRVFELLEVVGLEAGHFHRYPHEFSGGQRQRICIARALAVNPEFIICDECVSSLDVSVQAQVLNLLIALREQHQLTYIFISHDLSVVRFMSDRMLVMKDGKMEEMGPADEIYEHPQKEYTKRLIEAIPKGNLLH